MAILALWNPYKDWVLASPSSRLWTLFLGIAIFGSLLIRVLWLGIQTGWVGRSQPNVQGIRRGRRILNGLWWTAIALGSLQIVVWGWSLKAERNRLVQEQEQTERDHKEIESIASTLTTAQKSILLSTYTCHALKKSDVKKAIMGDQLRPIATAPDAVKIPLLIHSGETLVEKNLLKEARYIVSETMSLKLSMDPPKPGRRIGIGCAPTPLGLEVGKYLYQQYDPLDERDVPDSPEGR